jgi:hypothetical protein
MRDLVPKTYDTFRSWQIKE